MPSWRPLRWQVAVGAGGLGRQLAAESLEGLSALAQDGGKGVKGVAKVAAAVGEMVREDVLGAADVVGGEAVSSSLRAASDKVIEG